MTTMRSMRKPDFLRRLRLPRINMIIGKKQIIVAGLTVLLGAAIYVNYVYASSGALDNDRFEPEKATSYYGDAAFVSGGELTPTGSSETYDDARAFFAQARMDLQESRDEAKEFLEVMFSGGDARTGELEVIAGNAQRLSTNIESETKIENLLKAQGFADALVYISDRGVSVIVKTDELDAAGAAKIKNTLLSEVSVSAENITIVEIN